MPTSYTVTVTPKDGTPAGWSIQYFRWVSYDAPEPDDAPEPPEPDAPEPDAPEPDEAEPDPEPGNETKPSNDGGKDKSSLYEGRLIQVQDVRAARPRLLTNWLPQVTHRLEAGPCPRAAPTPRPFAQPGNSHDGSGRKEGTAKW